MTPEGLVFAGDIHGSDAELCQLLNLFGGQRHIIFLGDYVNRGPRSKAVINCLIRAKESWPQHITLLRGNHDQALLDFTMGIDPMRFVRLGGLTTAHSYVGQRGDDTMDEFKRMVPGSHIEFLEDLEDYYEQDDVFASHCGLDPENPAVRTRNSVSLTSHPDLFSFSPLEHIGKTVICGHYIQRDGRPHISDGFMAIDTGCGAIPGAPLTALLWPERTTIQFKGVR